MSNSRVVITGFGSINPLGLTSEQMWENLCSGTSGAAKITAFDPEGFGFTFAGQVPDFKIRDYISKALRKSIKLMSRDIELSVVAAHDAIQKSGLITKAIDDQNVNFDPTRAAINLGAGLISCDVEEIAPAVAACVTDGKFDIHKWGSQGLDLVTPLWLLKYLPNMLACHLGIIHDIQGPSNTITCGEASSWLAVSEATGVLSRGAADIALAGGGEAKVNPIVMMRQSLLKRSTCRDDDPAQAMRPFDNQASGSVFGEAAGMLILETLEHARSRGAQIYAEIAGLGESNSINPDLVWLESDGKGLAIAISKALEQASISAGELDLIIPHGTAIPADDKAEANAIQSVLGDAVKDIPIWPIKSMTTNTGAASGAIDMIAAIYAMNNSLIPAAVNFDEPLDNCKLNISNKPQQRDIQYALCCGYSFGGQCAAVVFKKFS